MAIIQVDLTSECLQRMVPIRVILPVEKLAGEDPAERGGFPTLYLLHGVTGNCTDWLMRTNILRYAEAKGLAVVMPSGENGFYVDHLKSHSHYGQFIGRELVDMTRHMFPLSRQRKDTFIAGLSMGGYGAIRNGMKYHDTFSYAAGLSTANVVENIEKRTNDSAHFLSRRDYAESIFGDLDKVRDSDRDPRWLAEQLKKQGAEPPRVYLACGTSDGLLAGNRKLRDDLRRAGVDVTYEEGPGDHEWDFWDRYIRRVLDWLPLEQET